jgi:hypothetical protein
MLVNPSNYWFVVPLFLFCFAIGVTLVLELGYLLSAHFSRSICSLLVEVLMIAV